MALTTPTAAPPDKGGDAGDLAEFGYEQQLHRSLGKFASFAAGFSFVSILTTIFQLFGLGFGFAGPAFFWTWPVVFAGQFLVACASPNWPPATRCPGPSTSGRGVSAARCSAGSAAGS